VHAVDIVAGNPDLLHSESSTIIANFPSTLYAQFRLHASADLAQHSLANARPQEFSLHTLSESDKS